MKKLLAVAVLALASVPAMAQYYHHHGYRPPQHFHHHHHRGPNWGHVVGGAILGAVIYDIYNRPVVVQQPPVVIQQPPVVVQQFPQTVQNCTPWTETQNADGSITRSRTCTQ